MRWAELALVALLALGVATPARAADRRPVPILVFHRVAEAPFARQMEALAGAGYQPVTLGHAWRAWHGRGTLPRRPVVLSFDDGYAGQASVAAPGLRRRGWRGVLNLQVGRLGARGGLRPGQVRQMLADGWELGAHTLTHPDLTTVGPATLEREVAGSRDAIARRFGVRPRFFCYPFGRHDATVERAVEAAGFAGATTTRRAVARPGGDPYALPRISVGRRTSPSQLRSRLRTSV